MFSVRALRLALLVSCVSAPSLTTQAPPSQRGDPYRLVLGTWELNVAKSLNPPKSQTRTYEMSGSNLKYTDHYEDNEGKEKVVVWNGRYVVKAFTFIGSTGFVCVMSQSY